MIVKPETPTGKIAFSRISPDGKWLAYSADDGGREEVYVTSFPNGNGRWQITREGGTFPVWRGDGKEVYYVGYDSHLYAVEVNSRTGEFEVGNSQSSLPDLACHFGVKSHVATTTPSGSPAPSDRAAHGPGSQLDCRSKVD
jgi:hypothetical protein